MEEIIAVFRMNEINPKTRARVIIKLGQAINHQIGGNFTEPIVYELVKILDPSHLILENESFRKRAGIKV